MSSLVVLAVFMLILYAVVRLTAKLAAALTGARHRSYRQVAARYHGVYENRGLVDPPTVSFAYNGSSVRLGLAPVVPGQPHTLRTRVVARFARGLPLRLELAPARRVSPPQPPKGTRMVSSGDADFDRAYLVRANDADMVREWLRVDAVRHAIEMLRRLAPPDGMLISVNPERLLVQVDRNLGAYSGLLDLAVREALVIHDGLVASVAARQSEGIAIVSAGPASPADSDGAPRCDVCGEPILGEHVLCAACRAPFHRDCWTFVGGCATFGCTCKTCVPN